MLFAFLEEVLSKENKVLGGREIPSDRVDTDLIRKWLCACQQLHPLTCKPHWTEGIQDIRLVDVEDRHVVQYPGQFCEYVALSYVWGNVEKQSFKLGCKLPPKVSQTIEDAMVLVKELEKRDLWVDSLCIDQFDDDDKRTQIKIMGEIYRCAYATIIALSGHSADAGLPRMGHNLELVPHLRCCVDGKQMVGLMPTLSQMLWPSGSPWGGRAWTLQEALLSRRCIYLSDFQTYYECNAMQCSESLDESQSYIHQLHRDADAEWSFDIIGGGCLRHNVHLPVIAREPLLVGYSTRLVLYMYRSMTHPTDAIDAFSGILQDLERGHGIKFHKGLPVRYFQWGLLWTAQRDLKRRKPEIFPSWSWAGWEGAVWQLTPLDIAAPCRYQCWLTVHDASQTEPQLLFSSTLDFIQEDSPQIRFGNDSIAILGMRLSDDPKFDLYTAPDARRNGILLLVEGIVFHFNPDYDGILSKADGQPDRPPWFQSGNFRVTKVSLKGLACGLHVIATDGELAKRPSKMERDFLLVARDYSSGYVYHWLLLLEFRDDGIAERVAIIGLLVPEIYLSCLWDAHPTKRRFLMS